MGARPYSPLLGRFLSVDPVEGGSANDYDYVAGDPINATDLDGKARSCKGLGWFRCYRWNRSSKYRNRQSWLPSPFGRKIIVRYQVIWYRNIKIVRSWSIIGRTMHFAEQRYVRRLGRLHYYSGSGCSYSPKATCWNYHAAGVTRGKANWGCATGLMTMVGASLGAGAAVASANPLGLGAALSGWLAAEGAIAGYC
jgi:hypothetical protein